MKQTKYLSHQSRRLQGWFAFLLTCVLTVSLTAGLPGHVAAQETNVEEEGVLVVRVLADSPAAAAGLRRGDIILSVDGTAVNSAAELIDVLANYAADDEIELFYLHGSEEITASATLAESDGRVLLGIVPYQEAGQFERRNDDSPRAQETVPFAMPDVPIQKIEAGALVGEVLEDSPAAAAGLQVGDVITAVNDDKVSGPEALVELIGGYAPDETVTLTVSRGDEELSIDVTLAAREDDAERGFMGVQVGPAFSGDMQWEEGQPFEFGMPFGRGGVHMLSGVLVRDVAEDSPAAEAGLQPGDWITAVNGEAVEDFEDLRALIDAAQPGDEMELTVQVRGDMGMFGRDAEATEPESRTVSVTLAENEEGKAFLGISVMPLRIDIQEMPALPDASGSTEEGQGAVPPMFFFRMPDNPSQLPFFFHHGAPGEDGVEFYFHGIPGEENSDIQIAPALPSTEL